MTKKKVLWTTLLLGIACFVFLGYSTVSNSIDCDQLVIDTYELHSGVDIPKVNFVNCYYDENSNTRISVYDLDANINLSRFERVEFSSEEKRLHGISLLNETERPAETDIYIASGEKWGNQWTYAVDRESRRLWASLKYED